MSFLNPTGRGLQRFYGTLYALLALGALALPFVTETDDLGRWFCLLFVVVLGLRSALHFWRASKLPPEEPAFPDVTKLPMDERTAVFKRAVLLGTPAIAFLSAWAAYDLKQLESGATDSVRLWAPIVMAYDMGGFWAAVLGPPAVFAGLMVYGYWKLRRDAAKAG